MLSPRLAMASQALKVGDAAQLKGCSAHFVLVMAINKSDFLAGGVILLMHLSPNYLTCNKGWYNKKKPWKNPRLFVGAEGVEPPTLCL